MQRLVLGVVVAVLATLVAPAPAQARKDRSDAIPYGVIPYSGVLIGVSEPSLVDHRVRVKFRRVGGRGQRHVRVGERHKLPGTFRWSRYRYTDVVELGVGEKFIFTTEGALPCAPARDPLGIVVEMKVKIPGKPWPSWRVYRRADHLLHDCAVSSS
ncbi:hypothetical protein [Nocardioides sp. zg-1228]|uniref:hypothetical protein n=1 Tax=Nocardioides sp. zg-1228 TaxID=2763008 RepID=UPI001642F01F|nr:hypothetical protein [Nocardioides sp. zg-1228]MBC2932824.1 hypothetical protein [Nocardioides sp. zg-1228]QSF56961.1 hypothetical protein JX575_15430 [Nocardioides sp. zg-1228]